MSRDVKVVAENGVAGVEWEIDGKKAKGSSLNFPKGQTNVTVKFDFKDKTNLGLRFDCAGPIWVEERSDDKCPPKNVLDPQIEVIECDEDELTITNSNEIASVLRYQLNFLDRNNNPVVCDPEIKNGGK